MRFILILLFTYSPLFCISQNDKVILGSEVNFEIKNAGLLVKGNFGEVKGFIQFEPKLYKSSKIKVSVLAKEINTGISARDKHLRKKEFLDVEQFPQISLESKFFGLDGNGYKGYFLLTLKGITKEVVIPFSYLEKGLTHEMKGEFVLNRLDFGVGEKSLIMADNIRVNINIKLKK